MEDKLNIPKWQKFDRVWYRKRYPSVFPIVNDIYNGDSEAYYKYKGRYIGHSPNAYFDEKWYLMRYPDVLNLINTKEVVSAFEHYCQTGYQTHSPHWLFDEEYYKESYIDNAEEFKQYKNAYDFYLSKGDKLLHSGSIYFNPRLFLLQFKDISEIGPEVGPYQYYLEKHIFDQSHKSFTWLIDEDWYLNTYPEVEKLIKRQLYTSGAHHYLANPDTHKFSPLADFSETYYDKKYADVASSTGVSIGLRNGYDHFLRHGFDEGRQPNAELNLNELKSDEDIKLAIEQKLFVNAFEYYVARQKTELFEVYYHRYFNPRVVDPLTIVKPEPTSLSEENIEPAYEQTVINDTVNQLEAESALVVSNEEKEEDSQNNENLQLTTLTIQEDPSLYVGETLKPKVEYEEYVRPNSVIVGEKDAISVEERGKASLNSEKAAWNYFDEDWYVIKYSDAMNQMKAMELDNVEEFYRAYGNHCNHSPNPYFDEKWYLETYPDVEKMVMNRQFVSGFEHYCKQGYLKNSPHWLFSETDYREQNSGLTDEALMNSGFINGYDHYLKTGDKEGLSGSPFFDPIFFVGKCVKPIQADLGAYAHYLKNIQINDDLQTSWYFDPDWYTQQYPEIQQEIVSNKFDSLLHHYLTNDTPSEFSPLLWFDESFYIAEYDSTIKQHSKQSSYRNGYAHFINKGIDLLLQPSPLINLGAYSMREKVKEDMKTGLYPNIFIHWLANHVGVDQLQDLDDQQFKEYIQVDEIKVEAKDYEGALWAQFDEEWYLLTYNDIAEKMESCGIDTVEEYYYQIGAYLGQSPNAYFDEDWYIARYESVQKAIKRGKVRTGFEHYCQIGFKTNDPHWLFSSAYYLRHNPNFVNEINKSDEYVNSYDHYLKKGDALRKTGSLYFDPVVYERYCYQNGDIEKTYFPYRNYLLNLNQVDRNATVSVYFDAEWYVKTYPEITKLLKKEINNCALKHYLLNETPRLFNPSPWFDENFYLASYSDIARVFNAEDGGPYRNGFEHFLLHGALECRNPHPDVDLRAYYLSGTVQEDVENGLFRDAFAHWVFNKRLETWINSQPDDSHYRLSVKTQESRSYFRKKSSFMLPTVAHQKLDFSYQGKPDISVVMLVKNQLPVTLTALASLRANFGGKIQLLIGDNNSSDDTRFIRSSLIGAYITRFAYNFGYGRACNYLIEQVQAPITLLLNNDIILYPGAVKVLCDYLLSGADIGAVGGKIIHPDGNLQEAGSIIWRDGATMGYLRGQDPCLAEANFVRDVDFCSAAMMVVRTNLLQQLKGFSPIYYPAYYEDTDLCVRIIKAGFRVVYHPDAVVEHMEYTSSDPIVSSGLTRRNHLKFIQANADFLRFQHPNHTDNIIAARQRVGKGKRVLFFEDRVPLRRLGSGYVRSNDIIHKMAELGYNLTVYPINRHFPQLFQIYSDIPETVEVLYDKTIDDLSEFLFKRAGYYDIIWIGRTHNLQRILPMLGEANRYIPQDRIILDTEVIAAPRTLLKNSILGIEDDETLEGAIETELSCARHCQMMITVNEIDASYARLAGFDKISILGHMMKVRATPKSFNDRKGLLFVGAIHDDKSPNFDSLLWFINAVWPILLEKMDDGFQLTIAGYVGSGVDLSVFSSIPRLNLLGPVEDLTELYNDHRVYVAPTRFAGGIPHKLHEAASFGIPIVATELLVNQLGWDDDKDILSTSLHNPEFFASQIIRLYEDEKLWRKLRENAFLRIDTECSEELFKDKLQQILTEITSHK